MTPTSLQIQVAAPPLPPFYEIFIFQKNVISHFTKIKNQLHTTFGSDNSIFWSEKVDFQWKMTKGGGANRISIVEQNRRFYSTIGLTLKSYILCSECDMNLIFGAKSFRRDIFYEKIKFQKGGQKGGTHIRWRMIHLSRKSSKWWFKITILMIF